MSNMPNKCIVDTNVPITANQAIDPRNIPDNLAACVLACVESIEYVVKKGRLVLDSGDDIFNEYRQNLSLSGQPGVGDRFLKWVHDFRWQLPDEDRVKITKDSESYEEFPIHPGLSDFDNSDRKFVAVANAHKEKPPILQATDIKWWGWKDALSDVGIIVLFLCPDYVKSKY